MRGAILAMVLFGLTVSPAGAGSLFGGGTDRHKSLLEGRLAQEYAGVPDEEDLLSGSGFEVVAPGPYKDMAREAAERYGVPVDLFYRLVRQESGWNPKAVSSKGAIGLAQIMPQTAERLGIDPHDAAENLEGGARYLSQMYRKFGTWKLALAAYNAGPDAVEQYDGVPPYAETEDYVQAILNDS